MRALKRKTSLYTFLKSIGILENGTNDEIQNARKEYWRKYKCRWRNEKRKKEKEFTISLNRDELTLLNLEAKRHKASRTKFIKHAAFAYINKIYLVPNQSEVRQIAQLLALTYNTIQDLIEENKIDIHISRGVLKSIHKLEREVLPLLSNPLTVEEQLEHYIKKYPEKREALLNLINSL
jgi:hypothetical protein